MGESTNTNLNMKCRKNLRKLIQAHNLAPGPTTALTRFVNAVVALKSRPSGLLSPHTQANRYDDYVYVHQQSMAGHLNSDPGPHPGHKGPLFFPWHREFLRQFELDLRAASGDPDMCLPYWDFSRDQSSADDGYPFIPACLGGNGDGPNNTVITGPFIPTNGFSVAVGGGGVTALQRQLGEDLGLAPTLPSKASITAALAETTYDAPGFDWNAPAASSFRNLVEGWVGPDTVNVHNRVHVWVGGSMGPSTSPNDPVFFLNHAKEDELWAVWEQKYPSVPHYLPDDSYAIPPAQHHLKRLSDHMDSLSEYFGAGTIDRPIDLLDHKAITWYDTDLPEISLESGPALAWNQSPAGLSSNRTIRFRVKSCRPVFFSVTGTPTGNFALVGGTTAVVTPVEANDTEVQEFQVRFTANGPDVQVGAIDIEAHIIDEEGYYAPNENDPFVVGNFHIELVANGIVTSDSSIVLVLDRSGSMSDVANNGFQKHQLLKSAVGVVHELMKDSDQIGIARFDHEADALVPMQLKTVGLGTTLTGTALDPRGATSIAAGILVGSGLINGAGATRPNKAMVVLTDGNETASPYISGLPTGTINQTTYAIGLGLPGQVSDPILDQISANSGGYLLVTGNMTSDSERFALAKYFIQILKDATRSVTISDPEGVLLWNSAVQTIPFLVSDTDVSVDVVVLCPVPIALDFMLETPNGRTIKPQDAGVEPNVAYVNGQEVCYYRLMLPAIPGDPAGSRSGTWKALLSLKSIDRLKYDLSKMGDKKGDIKAVWAALRQHVEKPVPYNMSVYAYSNLRMDASLTRSGYAPGATLTLTADLFEYDVPLARQANVWAEATLPNGSVLHIAMGRTATGSYSCTLTTTVSGVYRFRVRAEGNTSGNTHFTREKLLAGGVWIGGDRPYDPNPGGEGDKDCAWIKCLLGHIHGSKELQGRLKEWGFDVEDLLKCMAARCGTTRMLRERGEKDDAMEQQAISTHKLEEFLQRMSIMGIADLSPLKAGTSKAVVRRPKREGSPENMFIRPEDLKDKGKKGSKK
jgi:hypothetical protein